jgi:hypothetical protein
LPYDPHEQGQEVSRDIGLRTRQDLLQGGRAILLLLLKRSTLNRWICDNSISWGGAEQSVLVGSSGPKFLKVPRQPMGVCNPADAGSNLTR